MIFNNKYLYKVLINNNLKQNIYMNQKNQKIKQLFKKIKILV